MASSAKFSILTLSLLPAIIECLTVSHQWSLIPVPAAQLTPAATLQSDNAVACLEAVRRVGAAAGDGTTPHAAKWDAAAKVCEAKVVSAAVNGGAAASSGGRP